MKVGPAGPVGRAAATERHPRWGKPVLLFLSRVAVVVGVVPIISVRDENRPRAVEQAALILLLDRAPTPKQKVVYGVGISGRVTDVGHGGAGLISQSGDKKPDLWGLRPASRDVSRSRAGALRRKRCWLGY